MDGKQLILDTIGNTPLIKLKSPNPIVEIYAKLEAYNPTASIKDRIAKYIIDDAMARGIINENTHIIEGSSGNTAASVAMVCAVYGLPCTLYVPDKASTEKISLVASLGAEVIVKPTAARGDEEYGMAAKKAAEAMDNAFFVDQYNNFKNLEAHYHTTGKEIWAQTAGNIDYFVATASTGGTLCGCAKYLKEKNSEIKSVLADPVGSIYRGYFEKDKDYLSRAKPYLVEGAGKHRIVDVIDFTLIDEVMSYSDEEAFNTAFALSREEGIFAGGSSGGNVHVCYELAKKIEKPATIVTILPDSGLKYLSKFYNAEWMKAHF